ncbi:uncharacterized protein LOC134832598 [Culicoides brevitarsis]|uniref:uncharacterized protein LOC134832598 n=1 Tax=Culicoides brevitarsis TaxID=469753 RepID=UPI00307C6A1B
MEKLSLNRAFLLITSLILVGAELTTTTTTSTSTSDDTINCKNVICPALQEISCPDDSYSHTVFPTHMFKDFASKREGEKLSYDAIITENHEDEEEKVLAKRSILYEKRESIKIVPGGHHFFNHIHKRSLSPTTSSAAASGNDKYDYRLENGNNASSSSSEFIAALPQQQQQAKMFDADATTKHCCEYQECKCFPAHESNCKIPHCSKPLMKAVKRHATGLPGDCCDEYECIQPNYCESRVTGHRYPDGATWEDADCQTCRCENGETKCQMYFCKPLSCAKTILVPGACCQICDDTATDFCMHELNCNLHCPHGFQKSDDGCNLCKCAFSNNLPLIDTNYTNSTGDMENAVIDNHTVTLTNIQSICEDQLQSYIYVFLAVIAVLLLIIVGIVAYIIVQKRQKNSQSYKPVANIDSNFNSLPPSCTLKAVQQYEGV